MRTISAEPSRKDEAMNADLYQIPANGAKFATFCGGNLQSDQESCVQVAQIPGSTPGVILRDSKPEGSGRELRFTTQEMDNFVKGYAAQRGLSL
jgi:hypothetical protein